MPPGVCTGSVLWLESFAALSPTNLLPEGDPTTVPPSHASHIPGLLNGQSLVMARESHIVQRRRHHKRSRTGCSACKRKHIRCDETRPSCSSCVAAKNECQYPAPTLPLRDQRIGLQAIDLIVWQVPRSTRDPFGSLPIKMPYKSQRLLHYYAQATEADGTNRLSYGSRGREIYGVLGDATQEPTALRSTLIIAAIHYSWAAGTLNEFQQTFLYHKGETLRLVNEWLQKPDISQSSTIMKLIASLSIIESSLGNVSAAASHVSGLSTILDMMDEVGEGFKSHRRPKCDEILTRLLLMTNNYSCAVKSRLVDGFDHHFDLSDIWKKSFTGLSENLKSLRLLPAYLTTYSELHIEKIVDVAPVIQALRGITDAIQGRSEELLPPHYVVWAPLANPRNICDSEDSASCSGCRSLSALFLATTTTHVSSVYPAYSRNRAAVQNQPPEFPSQWCGICIATDLYLTSVLKLWNGGEPERPHIFRRLINILIDDLKTTEKQVTCAGHNSNLSALWFWKAFLGAYSFYRMIALGRTLDSGHAGCQVWLEQALLRWSIRTGTITWPAAKAVLEIVVWPKGEEQSGTAAIIWDKITELRTAVIDMLATAV
ncbi:hypothetical protein BX600DRAFT_466841 [Xylariales sp. PMI_506]|nr:hypothetical protein BX600DRAFT_466841 [Xylariales sp. PMI_506]